MNELNTRLLEYLPDPNTVKGGIGSVVETLQSEAPILVNEVLRWNLVMSLLFFITGILLLTASIFLGRLAKKNWKNIYAEDGECPVVIGLIILAFTGAGFMAFNFDWLQIWIAPRLFLLEYIGNLIK